jgi:hypothetical protein
MSFIISVFDDSDKQHAIEVATTDTILNLKLRCGFTPSKQMFYNGYELKNDATISSSEIVRSAKIWCPSKPPRILTILNGDQETQLYIFPTDTITDIKKRYKEICGTPLFSQKWITEHGVLITDDHSIADIGEGERIICETVTHRRLNRIIPWSATNHKEETTLNLF